MATRNEAVLRSSSNSKIRASSINLSLHRHASQDPTSQGKSFLLMLPFGPIFAVQLNDDRRIPRARRENRRRGDLRASNRRPFEANACSRATAGRGQCPLLRSKNRRATIHSGSGQRERIEKNRSNDWGIGGKNDFSKPTSVDSVRRPPLAWRFRKQEEQRKSEEAARKLLEGKAKGRRRGRR